MNNDLLNATEVATIVGTSVQTLNMWYRWARENPSHELSKLLPDYVKIGKCRYWKRDDTYKIIEFKAKMPIGRNGVMGSVTQKYVRRDKA